MSGNDAFDRAVRALRETGETPAADVARTRTRVLETLHRGQRRGRRTFWVLLPIAAMLAGSTALAKNGDVLRRAWNEVAERMGIVETTAKTAPPAVPAARLGARANSESTSAPPVEVPSTAPDEVLAPPSGVEQVSVGTAPSTETVVPAEGAPGQALWAPRARAERSGPLVHSLPRAEANPPPETPAPEAPSAAAPSGGEAASLEVYKKAYRLHFVEQRYAPALAAWDDYLRSVPAGRLIIEARYNRAIALVRLGRQSEAEAELAPFARGEIGGGYRAREARELLDALRVSR